MNKKLIICYVLVGMIFSGCTDRGRAIAEVKAVIHKMQMAKRYNNSWEYVRYFDHGYIEVVHYPDRTVRRSLTKEYARRGIYEWRLAVSKSFEKADITKYHVDQPALFCLPMYEDVDNFTFKMKNRRTVLCSYKLRTMGLKTWIEYDVWMTFVKGGMEGEWTVVRVERGPERRIKGGSFN